MGVARLDVAHGDGGGKGVDEAGGAASQLVEREALGSHIVRLHLCRIDGLYITPDRS